MSSTPPPPPPLHYPGHGGRVGHRLRPVAIVAVIALVLLIAAAVTALIVLGGTPSPHKPPPMLPDSHGAAAAPKATDKPAARGMAVKLTAADPVDIAQGISTTLAPGWTLADRGPNSVTLYNGDSTARMQVEVKPAGGTDVVAVLQADINRLTGTASTGLTNVVYLSGPATKTLSRATFQQQASIDYTADISTQQGTVPILGAFDELLNTSNQLSAFIDYRQDGNSTTQSASDGGMMIRSML